MTNCEHCKLIEEKELVVFEDKDIVAVLSKKAVSKGHVLVMPKQHLPILEQIPDELVERIFIVANKVSTAMFEALRINGTNIIVENGTPAGQKTPHFAVNVIPRTENDGLKLGWKHKKFTDEQISMAEMQLKQEVEGKKKETAEIEKKEEVVKDDYLLKQLRRVP